MRACKTYKSVCNLKFNKNILTPGEGVGTPQKHSVRTCHRCFTSGLGRAESVNFTHSKTTNSHPAPPLLFAYRSLLTTAIHDILCIYYNIYKTCVLLLIMYTFVHYTHTVVPQAPRRFLIFHFYYYYHYYFLWRQSRAYALVIWVRTENKRWNYKLLLKMYC